MAKFQYVDRNGIELDGFDLAKGVTLYLDEQWEADSKAKSAMQKKFLEVDRLLD